MYREYLRDRIGSLIFITGTLIRGLSSQTFAEKHFEITPEQYVLLTLLAENGEMYQRQLAEITFKDRANISRIIEILHQKGLVEKIPDSNGRRIYKLILTSKGKEVRKKIFPTDINLIETITKDLSQEELTTTLNTLEKINMNIRDKVKLQI